MNKTVDRSLTQQQWEELRYPINLQALTEEEDGGWFATIPLLGEATCAADGETIEEALANLEELRRSLYEVVIASKHPIALPQAATETKEKPAGKWLMRASTELHARLQEGAFEANVSFNTYCVECLSRGHDAHVAKKAVEDGMADLKKELVREVSDKVRREVRDEMRVAAQDIAEELSYERARMTFFDADIYIEETNFVAASTEFLPNSPARLSLVDMTGELKAA